MNCELQWNFEFIDLNFPKTWRQQELKKHRENVLLEREKIRLPDAMPLVAQEMLKRSKLKEIEAIYEQRNALMLKIAELDRTIIDIRTEYLGIAPKHGSVFIRKCVKDDCRGFLNQQWHCGLCQSDVCSTCHDIKATEHTCLPENIETANLIMKTSKPCPKCGINITRIEGCSQMFCTACKTAFDYNTGRIETRRIHNPHYYEWLQRNGDAVPREPLDVVCGGIPTYRNILTNVKKVLPSYNFGNIYQGLIHMQDVELPEVTMDDGDVNMDLRVKYLMSEITEENWKKELQKREKKKNKLQAQHQLIQMLITVGTDLFTKMVSAETSDEIKQIDREFESLRQYFNTSMDNIITRFGSTATPRNLTKHWLYRFKTQEDVS